MGQSPRDSSDRMALKDRNQGNSQRQTGIRVRLSINGVPWRQEVWAYVVQGDIVEQLMWTEERAHHWSIELAAVEHVDAHGCSRDHHRYI